MTASQHRRLGAADYQGSALAATPRSSGYAGRSRPTPDTAEPRRTADLSRQACPSCRVPVLPWRLNSRKVRACGARYAAWWLLGGSGRARGAIGPGDLRPGPPGDLHLVRSPVPAGTAAL